MELTVLAIVDFEGGNGSRLEWQNPEPLGVQRVSAIAGLRSDWRHGVTRGNAQKKTPPAEADGETKTLPTEADEVPTQL